MICAVNGIAAGAGANVALACDLVYAARSASFLQAFARIGLVPDAGRHLDSAAPRRPRARPRAHHAGRAAFRREGRGVGADLEGGRRRQARGGGGGRGGQAGRCGNLWARPHQARASPNPPPTRSPSSSISSATCSAWPAPRPTPRRASARSSRSVRRSSPGEAHDARRGRDRAGERGGHVGGRQGHPRHGHENREGRPGSCRPVHERGRQHGQRARPLPWRLHLLAGGFGLCVRLQLPQPAPCGPALPDLLSGAGPSRHAPHRRGARALSRRAQRPLRRDGEERGG